MLVLILALFAPTPTLAATDSFEIIQNGQKYLCSPEAGDPGGVLDCIEIAYQGPFSRDEANQLCAGASSRAPADCAADAFQGSLSKAESIALCQHAISKGPNECFNKAFQGPFSHDEAFRLCRQTGSVATADCAIRAFAGPYNKEQAINLCRGNNPALVSLALQSLHQESRVGFGAVLGKAREKAARD